MSPRSTAMDVDARCWSCTSCQWLDAASAPVGSHVCLAQHERHISGGALIADCAMSLFRVDASLLDLHDVDEDESEAVALAAVEFLFAETNAYYRQHCVANHAVQSTSSLLASSIFDAVTCSRLGHEDSLDFARFQPEQSPVPEINDRHAAWCLPHRSPRKLDIVPDRHVGTSPSQRTRPDSMIGEGSRMSFARKRPSPDKRNAVAAKMALFTIPQTIILPEVSDEESSEDKAWRSKCLKELSGDRGLLSKLGKSTKWGTFARQISALEPRASLDVEIIDSTSSLLRQELTGASTVVKMKSSLNTFSSISNVCQRTSSAASSKSSRVPDSETNQRRLSNSHSVATLAADSSKTTASQHNDHLSRKRPVLGPVSAHHNGSSTTTAANVDLWQFQNQTATPRTMRNRFSPDMMVASATTIPTMISLSAGVELKFGDSVAKGPLRRENDHTMSKKHFELHQRLATDHLLQESIQLQQVASSIHSPVGSRSPSPSQSHQHRQVSPRPYETVPAEPLPAPTLSPIGNVALTIPPKHLTQSASTPTLRVRKSTVLKRGVTSSLTTSSTHPLVTNEELDAMRKARPASALSAVIITTPRQMRQTGDAAYTQRPRTSLSVSSKRDTAKYTREFPKPHAGTIKLNSQKGSLLTTASGDVDSARQRMVWIS